MGKRALMNGERDSAPRGIEPNENTFRPIGPPDRSIRIGERSFSALFRRDSRAFAKIERSSHRALPLPHYEGEMDDNSHRVHLAEHHRNFTVRWNLCVLFLLTKLSRVLPQILMCIRGFNVPVAWVFLLLSTPMFNLTDVYLLWYFKQLKYLIWKLLHL